MRAAVRSATPGSRTATTRTTPRAQRGGRTPDSTCGGNAARRKPSLSTPHAPRRARCIRALAARSSQRSMLQTSAASRESADRRTPKHAMGDRGNSTEAVCGTQRLRNLGDERRAARRPFVRVVDLSALYAEVGSSGGVRCRLRRCCFGGRTACPCPATARALRGARSASAARARMGARTRQRGSRGGCRSGLSGACAARRAIRAGVVDEPRPSAAARDLFDAESATVAQLLDDLPRARLRQADRLRCFDGGHRLAGDRLDDRSFAFRGRSASG
jgi:hypothetical protein